MNTNSLHGQKLLSEKELAALLAISPHTVQSWRKRRVGLNWHKHFGTTGNHIPHDHPTYASAVVTAWVESRRVTPRRSALVPCPAYDLSKLLTQDEAAALLGVTASTLKTWRKRGKGPRYVPIARQVVRYTQTDLEAWRKASPHLPN